MSKSIFEILDKINKEDIENKTANVEVFPDMVSFNETKKGAHITMGAPVGAIRGIDVMQQKKILLLVSVDREQYEKYAKQ